MRFARINARLEKIGAWPTLKRPLDADTITNYTEPIFKAKDDMNLSLLIIFWKPHIWDCQCIFADAYKKYILDIFG